MKQSALMQDIIIQKKRFLFYLRDAINNQSYQNYEPACQILAEFIDRKIVQLSIIIKIINEFYE